MMVKGRVSILTPSYNAEKYLEVYFMHLLEQTYKNFELIFVDDGSIDETKKIVEKYEKCFEAENIGLIYKYQDNKGQASAINLGLQYVTGEYLYWMDADDYLENNALEKMVNFLEKNKEYNIVKGRVRYIYEVNNTSKVFHGHGEYDVENVMFEKYLFDKDIDCYPGLIMTRTDFFDERVENRKIYESRGGQNWQLILPIAYKQKCKEIDSIIYNYMVRENSHSNSIKNSFKARYDRYNEHRKILVNILKRMKCMRLSEKIKYITMIKCKYFIIELKLIIKKLFMRK